jgi:hypothetical protein
MAINTEGQSASVATDDNLLVMIAPASILGTGGTSKKLSGIKLSDLSSATFVDVTYDLTAGSGWAESTSQETIADDRLTLAQVFSQPGKVTNGLTVQYVYGSDSCVADPLLVQDEDYVAAVRWAVPHDQALAQTDEFDFWYIRAGVKQRDQAAANAVFTKTQVLFPQKFKVLRDQVPAAA